MTLSIEIRKLLPTDIDSINPVFRSEFGRTHSDDLQDQSADALSFYIALHKNNPVGFGLVTLQKPRSSDVAKTYPDCPEIYRLTVLENYQSNGIGTKIINACEQEAQHKGYSTIGIGVGHTNTKAQKLYLRLGYRDSSITGYIDKYKRLENTGEITHIENPCYWLIKDLG